MTIMVSLESYDVGIIETSYFKRDKTRTHVLDPIKVCRGVQILKKSNKEYFRLKNVLSLGGMR